MVTKFNHGYKLFKPVFCYRFSLCVFPRMAWGNLWKENLLLTLFIYNFTNAAETFFFHSFLCFSYLYPSKVRTSFRDPNKWFLTKCSFLSQSTPCSCSKQGVHCIVTLSSVAYCWKYLLESENLYSIILFPRYHPRCGLVPYGPIC